MLGFHPSSTKILKQKTTLILLQAFLLLALCLYCTTAEARKKKRCHKRVGYFASRNPEKLTRKLCRGLTTDSAKVAAIHCWITSNISYDHKKLLSNDFRVNTNKSILRRRQAICYGYCTLFKEMCTYAGIQSVIVSGYTKNNSVDVKDSFYLEDHSWNAVLIDNEWYLSDLTWDAGYSTYWRRGFRNSVSYIFSFGKIDKMLYKPKFYQSPQWEYFLRSGDYFLYDHLPADPIWQLTDVIVSPNDFMLDSSHYFMKGASDSNTYSALYDAERSAYYSNSDTVNQIQDGFRFNDFNYHNHYQIMYAYSLLVVPFARELDFRSKDSILQLELADSIIRYATQSIEHADSNERYLLQQKEIQLEHLKQKNTLLKEQNKILRKSDERIINFALKGKRFSGKLDKFIRKTAKQNTRNFYKLANTKDVFKSKPSGNSKAKDTIALLLRIDSLENLRDIIRSSQDSLQDAADAILQSLFPNIEKAILFGIYKYNSLDTAWRMRKIMNVDDFDYLIRKLKDSLLFRNAQNDSLLFSNKISILDSIYNCFKGINVLYKRSYALSKEKLKAYRTLRMKSPPWASADIINRYYLELKEIETYLNAYKSWQKQFVEELESIKGRYRALKKACNSSIKENRRERRFILKPRQIHMRQNALKRLSRYREKYSAKQLKRALRAMEKFTKKIG